MGGKSIVEGETEKLSVGGAWGEFFLDEFIYFLEKQKKYTR
jgi:hypothetical protein